MVDPCLGAKTAAVASLDAQGSWWTSPVGLRRRIHPWGMAATRVAGEKAAATSPQPPGRQQRKGGGNRGKGGAADQPLRAGVRI